MKKTDRPDSENRTKERRTRPPVNGKGDVLNVVGKDPDYNYRIFNDKGTRIAQYQEYGWEVASSDEVTIGTRNAVQAGTRASVTVDSSDGTQGVVMRIRKDWHEEDQAAKQQLVDDKESGITNSKNENGNYGKVSIER